MYPIFLISACHIACIVAVSKSASFDNYIALWAWVTTNLVLSSSIYAPIVSGKDTLFLLHWSLVCLVIINALYLAFWGNSEWLSLDPYIVIIFTSFAVDYYRIVHP